MPLNDLTGQRFGQLTVIERAKDYISPDGFSKAAMWRCRCECGNETTVIGRNLKNGAVKSCGCWRRERAARMRRGERESE